MPGSRLRVRWLRQALADLESHAQYIARDNPAAASRVVAAIDRAVTQLADFPDLGRPGRVEGTRELVVPGTKYIVPYRVREQTIEILRVFHAARKWPLSL